MRNVFSLQKQQHIETNKTTGFPVVLFVGSAAAAAAAVVVAAAAAVVAEDTLVVEEHEQQDDDEPGAAVGAKQAVRHGKTSSPKRARLHPIIRRAAHVVIDFCIADGLTVKNKVALRFAVSG